MRLTRLLLVACAALAAAPLHAGNFLADWRENINAEADINRLGEYYLQLELEQWPTDGIAYGLHGKDGDPTFYDDRLPDPTVATAGAFDAARETLLRRLGKIDASALGRSDQIDLRILNNRVKLDLFRAQTLRLQESPSTWSQTLSYGLSGLVGRDYAPLDQRLLSLGRRCAGTANYLAGVRAILTQQSIQPPAVDKSTALAQFRGFEREGGLFDKVLPAQLAASKLASEQQAGISADCKNARRAIHEFADWFEKDVLPRADGEWRTGKAVYDEQYALQLDYPLSPDDLLAQAEARLDRESKKLVATARAIHDEFLAAEIAAGSIAPQAELGDQQVVKNAFDKMAEDRPTVDSLVEDSYALADSIVGFVREHQLMDLPPASKLRIEAVPPQLSGTAVAFIYTAPPFEPDLESVWFWDLDLLRTSPDFLKEYNRPMLALVYIHEGVPGHFVQLEYSNRAQRVIPRVFWNGAMVEGWASYITTQLVEQGFTVYPGNPIGYQIQQLADSKVVLRSVINAIIDLRLNRSDWSEEEALALMLERGYQQEGEARGKIQRAQTGAVQLSSYFAGQLAIEQILAEYRELRGDGFSYKEFNEKLVSAGSPPFFAIREFMLQPPPGEQ